MSVLLESGTSADAPALERGCGCPGCAAGLVPFTREHFRVWALDLELDNGEPWVVEEYFLAFVDDVFAGFPASWLVVPEGNAKTTNLAGLAIYHCEHTRAANVPWAASARDQAEIGYTQAEGFVLNSSRLSAVFVCQAGYRKIKHRTNRSKIQIFASDEKTGDGVIPTFAIVDEAHRHKNLGLIRTWRGKLRKRKGQMVVISTAGEPGGEFEETRTKMRQAATDVTRERCFVRAAGPAFVLHEWAVPEKGDVEDLELVAAANPASFVTVETLAEKRADPTMTLSHWRRFTCSLATRGANAAITEVEWNHAGREYPGIPEGERIDAGFDAGWKWDTTAIVPFWASSPELRVFGVPTILEPPRNGSSLDPDVVKRALVVLHDRNPVQTLVMDTSRAEDIASWAGTELGCEVVDRSQTNAFAVSDYDAFMEALRSGWIRQPGDPEFTRHVLNAVAKTLPGGDTRFERPHATRAKTSELQDRRVIDALTAAAMVHSLYASEIAAGDSAWFGFGDAA